MTKGTVNNESPAPAPETWKKKIRPEGVTRARWKKRRRVKKIMEFWPKLFDINNPKRLKINIMQDMAEDIQTRGLDVGRLMKYVRIRKNLSVYSAGY